MVDRIGGRLSKRNKKLKKTTSFTIDGEIPKEKWAELYEAVKATLDQYGVKLKKVKA